jgi:hypothetical protein
MPLGIGPCRCGFLSVAAQRKDRIQLSNRSSYKLALPYSLFALTPVKQSRI